MLLYIIMGLLVPALGTALGASFVFFMRQNAKTKYTKLLNGFAAGVMTAASVWSLIIPSIELWENHGRTAFVPAVVGYWAGVLFIPFLESKIPYLEKTGDSSALAIVIHNVPEGMAVGAALAGVVHGDTALGSAIALSFGIAIQNIPEGSIISMPARAAGKGRAKSFGSGVASGLVEPVGGALTLVMSEFLIPLMPYLLSFAAGTMFYVVITELIPDIGKKGGGADMFSLGFTVMLALDVALG